MGINNFSFFPTNNTVQSIWVIAARMSGIYCWPPVESTSNWTLLAILLHRNNAAFWLDHFNIFFSATVNILFLTTQIIQHATFTLLFIHPYAWPTDQCSQLVQLLTNATDKMAHMAWNRIQQDSICRQVLCSPRTIGSLAITHNHSSFEVNILINKKWKARPENLLI